MKIRKRNGEEQDFTKLKIISAIEKANKTIEGSNRISNNIISEIAERIEKELEVYGTTTVEIVHNKVEEELSKINYQLAKNYIIYRYEKKLKKKFTETEEKQLAIAKNKNEDVSGDNANKRPILLPVRRDYFAGTDCKAIAKKILSKEIIEAHDNGLIHYHDMDYSPVMSMNNCGLVDVKNIFEEGFMLNDNKITEPKSFRTACNLVSQITMQVSNFQYGGQTFSLAHLAKYVDVSRKKIREEVLQDLESLNPNFQFERNLEEFEEIEEIVNRRLLKEIKDGIQTYQYQILTLITSNGQTPFCSMAIDFNDCNSQQEEKDLALVIEEVFNQRKEGIPNENGVNRPILFPKLLYVLDEGFNVKENDPYYYLTEMAAECVVKTMQPDFVSAKKSRELKDGIVVKPMGAVAGNEIVSIKIEDTEYNNISVKEAIELLQCKKTTEKDVELKNICGVYKIEYKPTGNYYIGSSKNIQQRFREYRYSISNTGAIEGNIIGDRDVNNYNFELIEECSIDELFDKEMEHINLNDKLIINTIKTPRNSGNGVLHSKNRERQVPYTKVYNCKEHCFIKSKGQWEPIEMFEINDEDVPLDIYDVSFNLNGEEKTIRITEDHPLHTQRGRIQCCDLKLGDMLYASETYAECPIVKIEKVNEKIKTYDFTTSNDMFDLSGIISHNCRSFLTPYFDKDVEIDSNTIVRNDETKEWVSLSKLKKGDRFNNGNKVNEIGEKYIVDRPRIFSRFNQGVITLNIPFVALKAKRDNIDFWKLLDESLEICHKALITRHQSLLGTKAEVAPILWQWGAYLRLKADETIDKYLLGDYSTISLGYVGLYETCMALIQKSNTTKEGSELALKIMKRMNDKCEEWKSKENIPYSIYGTPEEATTEKFANALKRNFGIIEGVTDHGYVTNSYHVNPAEQIDAFSKINFESQFLSNSKGGAVSYIEATPSIRKNIAAVVSLIKYMYENILYCELNTKLDYCYQCGSKEELNLIQKNGKYIFKCKVCGCEDQTKLSGVRRLCGYIGEVAHGIGKNSPNANQGRLADIFSRVVHI